MNFEDLPIMTQATALKLLREAERNVNACGDSGVAVGYWVESHTIGCREAADDAHLWETHWEFWDKYSQDGVSILIGDPAKGAFVSITPQKNQKATMGAEMLIELGRRVKKTIPLSRAMQVVETYYDQLRTVADPVIVAGSIRRRRPEIGDVEFVVLPKDMNEFREHVEAMGFEGGDRVMRKMDGTLPIELYIAHKPEELGALLFMYTGDWQHNIAMRSIAKRAGWKLDQYGIWDPKTGAPLLQSPDERDFYDFLGVPWHNPEDRSFKDRPKKKKKATMGAEMLIELGNSKRKVGYINLELLSPEEDKTDNWVLKIERTDPFGGEPWKHDVLFEEQDSALTWFNTINGDEDLDALISQTS